MTIQLNSKAIVIAAVCTVLSANVSTAKASPFQSALADHLSSGTIILVQDSESPGDVPGRSSAADTGASPQSEYVVGDPGTQIVDTGGSPEGAAARGAVAQELADKQVAGEIPRDMSVQEYLDTRKSQ